MAVIPWVTIFVGAVSDNMADLANMTLIRLWLLACIMRLSLHHHLPFYQIRLSGQDASAWLARTNDLVGGPSS